MITQKRVTEIRNLVYELENDGHFVAAHAINDLLAAVDRAHEALIGLRRDGLEWDDPDDLIVKYRLGAFITRSDSVNRIIDYGLGKCDPDPSVQKDAE